MWYAINTIVIAALAAVIANLFDRLNDPHGIIVALIVAAILLLVRMCQRLDRD